MSTKSYKKIMFMYFIVSLLISLVLIFCLSPIAHASGESPPVVTKMEKSDYSNAINYTNISNSLNLTDENFLSAYRIDDLSTNNTVGIVNLYDSKSGFYYNLYIDHERKIEYVTTQKENTDGTIAMSLYKWNGSDFDTGFIEKFDSQGNIIGSHRVRRASVNKLAAGWACLFSSYIACVSASLGAGAAGSLIGGPWGVALGIGGGFACKFVFQHLVERFGGKDAACTWVRNLKNTWSTVTG